MRVLRCHVNLVLLVVLWCVCVCTLLTTLHPVSASPTVSHRLHLSPAAATAVDALPWYGHPPSNNARIPVQVSDRQKLVFLKTHKTASSVVTHMLLRIGRAKELLTAIPHGHSFHFPHIPRYEDVDSGEKTTNAAGVAIIKARQKEWKAENGSPHRFELLCNHMCYAGEETSKVVDYYFGHPSPASVRWVTVLRRPESHFLSSLHFFYGTLANGLDGFTQLHGFFKTNSGKIEVVALARRMMEKMDTIKSKMVSLADTQDLNQRQSRWTASHLYSWYNGQSNDLGLWKCGSPEDPDPSQERMDEFIAHLGEKFDLVMITERLGESLVLLGALMGWTNPSYMAMPPLKLASSSDTVRVADLLEMEDGKELLAQINTVLQYDHQLYGHFEKVFAAKVVHTEAAEGSTFTKDVEHLKAMNQLLLSKCQSHSTGSHDEGSHKGGNDHEFMKAVGSQVLHANSIHLSAESTRANELLLGEDGVDTSHMGQCDAAKIFLADMARAMVTNNLEIIKAGVFMSEDEVRKGIANGTVVCTDGNKLDPHSLICE